MAGDMEQVSLVHPHAARMCATRKASLARCAFCLGSEIRVFGASRPLRRPARTRVFSSVVGRPRRLGVARRPPPRRCPASVRGLVGQTGRAVLHLGDLGLGVALRDPVLVRELLARRLRPGAPGPRAWVSRCRSPGQFAPESPNPRPWSLRTMLRDRRGPEASTPMRSPLTRPASAKSQNARRRSPCGPHGAGARGSVTARNGPAHDPGFQP